MTLRFIKLLIAVIGISLVSKAQTIDTTIVTSLNDTLKHYNTQTYEDEFYKLNFKVFNEHPFPQIYKPKQIDLVEAQTFVMSNGLTVILIENNKLPLVSFKMFFDIHKLYLGERKGSDLIFLDIWGKKGNSFSKSDVEHYIQRYGTKKEVGENYIYIEGLSRHKYNHMSMLADLSLGLQVNEKEFQQSKKRISDSLYFESRKNSYISENVGKSLIFGKNSPIGERVLVDAIDSLSISDIRQHYSNYYNSSNAYLVVYGDVSLNELKKMTNMYFKKYKRSEVPRGYYSQPYNLQNIEIDYIENYSQDSLSVWMANVEEVDTYQENWLYNRLAKNLLFDVNAGLFVNKLLKTKMVSNLRYKMDISDKYFSISYDVSPDKVSNSIKRSLDILRTSVGEQIDQELMKQIKESLNINYVNGLRDPHVISDFYLLHYLTGSDVYLMPNFMETVDSLQFTSISNALEEIIKPDQMRIVVSGPPQIAVPLLEKLNYKISYFDELGEETFPPSLDRPAPDSLRAEDVLHRYQQVIGGRDNIEEVTKMLQWWSLDISGEQLYVKSKFMMPHYRLSTYSNREITIMKTVFGDDFGYVESSGEIKEYLGKEFVRLRTEKSIFPELYYLQDGYLVTLESEIPLKGEACYKLRCEAPYGELVYLYFSIKDGYLIRKEYVDIVDDKISSYFDYSDFKKYNNIIFPYIIETSLAGKRIKMVMTQILLNDKNVKKNNFN